MGSAPPAAEGGDAVHQALSCQRQREEGVDVFIKLHEIQSQCSDQAEPFIHQREAGSRRFSWLRPASRSP